MCNFSIRVLPTFFKFTTKKKTLSRKEPCHSKGKFIWCWQRLKKRRDTLIKNPFSRPIRFCNNLMMEEININLSLNPSIYHSLKWIICIIIDHFFSCLVAFVKVCKIQKPFQKVFHWRTSLDEFIQRKYYIYVLQSKHISVFT